MYPIYINQPGVELPERGSYYLIAGNGVFLHKDNFLFSGFTKVESPSYLDDFKFPYEVRNNLPKLPAKLTWAIKELFRRVVDKYHAEANTQIYIDRDSKEFQIRVPRQVVSHGSVNYDNLRAEGDEKPSWFILAGTIHSHADFAAFHSGTDVEDEHKFDGLHVTFGHNDQDVFTISATLVIAEKRYKLKPEDCLEGIEPVGDKGYYRLSGTPEYDEAQLTAWMENIRGR